MSAHLLAAAFACDEGNTFDCEAASLDGKVENVVHEAMSHTATEGMPAATDEAISHKSCPDPKDGGGKNGHPVVQLVVRRRRRTRSKRCFRQQQG